MIYSCAQISISRKIEVNLTLVRDKLFHHNEKGVMLPQD